MAGVTTLHWEAVPNPVARLLRDLSSALPAADYYLAGGTALALQLGHRISEDLDLFSASMQDPEALFSSLRGRLPTAVATLIAERTLYLEVDGCTASFFRYDYRLLEPPVDVDPGVVPLAHPDDIAAMKLAAIASRGSRKDFVDLWTLVTRYKPLARYLDGYRAKYVGHDTGHVIRSLTYFDDAEHEPPLRLLVDVAWPTVKADLTRWTSALLAG